MYKKGTWRDSIDLFILLVNLTGTVHEGVTDARSRTTQDVWATRQNKMVTVYETLWNFEFVWYP